MALHIVIGPMFSGKSSHIIRVTNRERHIGRRVLMVNHLADTVRNPTGHVRSHDGHESTSISVSHIGNLVLDVADWDVIAVDEGQFFEDIHKVLDFVNSGVVVYISALDGDAQQKKFGSVLDLIPHADTCIKLQALCVLCRNGTKASFTVKTCGADAQVDVGGADKYMAVCRNHLLKNELVERCGNTEQPV